MSVCLMTLSNDLLLHIFEYVLPSKVVTRACAYRVCDKTRSALRSIDSTIWKHFIPLHSMEHTSDLSEVDLDIASINRRLRQIALRIIHNRSTRLKVMERKFFDHDDSKIHSATTKEPSRWTTVFPWLDLSKLRHFHIKIQPTNNQWFWQCLDQAMTSLCEQRLRENI